MRYLIWLAVATVIIFSGTAAGDEVVLKNGEMVKGTVKGFSDGKIVVSSETMGDVNVPLDQVVTFSTEAPIEMHFKDESRFNQKISASDDGWIAVPVGPEGRLQQFKVADIDKINPPKTRWKGSLSAGAVIVRGNAYDESAQASLFAVRRGEIDRITFDAGYASARSKDSETGELSTTKRRSFAGLQYDYFLTKEWYTYLNARGERDADAKIDVRLLTGAGAGWQVVESDTFNFAAEAGISWISENYLRPDLGDPPTDDTEYFSARLAYLTDAKFNDAVSFFHNAVVYPGFEAEGGYYVFADGGLRSSLTDSMFAEAKVVWRWDSTPAEAKKRTDVSYLFSIGWTF